MAGAYVTGVEQINARFAVAGKIIEEQLDKSLDEAAKIIADAARGYAPARTGALKKAIHWEKSRRNPKERIVTPYDKGARHGHLVEYGTMERHQSNGKSVGKMPAHPFMRPAVDSSGWQKKVEDDMRKAVAAT